MLFLYRDRLKRSSISTVMRQFDESFRYLLNLSDILWAVARRRRAAGTRGAAARPLARAAAPARRPRPAAPARRRPRPACGPGRTARHAQAAADSDFMLQ